MVSLLGFVRRAIVLLLPSQIHRRLARASGLLLRPKRRRCPALNWAFSSIFIASLFGVMLAPFFTCPFDPTPPNASLFGVMLVLNCLEPGFPLPPVLVGLGASMLIFLANFASSSICCFNLFNFFIFIFFYYYFFFIYYFFYLLFYIYIYF